MNIKYCLPIIKESKEEIISIISENPDYDFYEIWLAYVRDLDTDFVWKLSEQHNGKLIFVFRKQNLEKSEIDKDLREKIIKLLENSDNLMDLDINDGSWGLDYIKQNNLQNKTIASFHNYEETPAADELEKLVSDMEVYKPEIYKISTFCKTPEDALKLLNVLFELKNKQKKFIVLGMGDEGKVVRIYGALWGNELNFAPIDENEKSAPGQFTRNELEKILKELDPASSAE